MAKKPYSYLATGIGRMENDYYNFNIKEEGKSHGSSTDSQWWRGAVRFYGEHPRVRFMGRLPDTNKPAFIYERDLKPDEELIDLWYAKAIEVPNGALGVFSRFEGDQIDIPSTHERVRFLMLSVIREFVMETLPKWTATKLTPYVPQYDMRGNEIGHYWQTHKEVERRQGREAIRDWLLEQIARYNMYTDAFALGWPDVPPMYREQFEAIAEKKLNAYTSPKAVAQRERAAARKLAVKALGIPVAKKAA